MNEPDAVAQVDACVCPNCGARLGPDDTACPVCQTDLPAMDTYVCTECGAPVAADAATCPRCGADVSEVMVAPSPAAEKLMTRYTAGYGTADALLALGGVVKVVGYVLAGLVALLGFLTLQSGLITFLTLVLYAVLLGLLFYIGGALVSAAGQRTRAVLDTAVNGSPFLTDDQRAEIMSL